MKQKTKTGLKQQTPRLTQHNKAGFGSTRRHDDSPSVVKDGWLENQDFFERPGALVCQAGLLFISLYNVCIYIYTCTDEHE